MIPVNSFFRLRHVDGKRYFFYLQENDRISPTVIRFDGKEMEFHQCGINNTWVYTEDSKVVLTLATPQEQGRPAKQPIIPAPPRSELKSNIGDLLEKRFASLGMHPVVGCPCKELQYQLNRYTVEEIEQDLTAWATRLQSSARKWKELKGGIWNFIPSPPLILCEKVIRDAIEESKCSGATA